jgi:hypothetical protein
MKLDLFIHWKDFDKDGNIIGESSHKANSLVIAMARLLMVQITSTSQSIVDMGGTTRTNAIHANNMRVNSPANDNTYGIMVGTSSTAVAVTDTALGARIAHGTGAGQLSYGAMTFDPTTTTSGSSVFFNCMRVFTNNSGADITIEEVGLGGVGSSNAYLYLMDRTLSPKTILAGNGTTCTYTIQITV